MTKLWGGRFEGAPDPRFDAFQRSLRFDRRLADADVVGSIAWARGLEHAKVLSSDEGHAIVGALEAIRLELKTDVPDYDASDAEDVHAFIEARLQAKVGDLARKLHTGRSRNDQVATDLKIWMRVAVADIGLAMQELVKALLDLAEANAALPIPGYTHLQRAQPITVGHHLLAYVEMLWRDHRRLADGAMRSNECPLGSGALAGTAWSIDRDAIAKDLGFAAASRNSLDAVSDRDHVCELASACSLIAVHLSRLAEDWIFFASTEAGFLELSDAVATGSSLMPQKKNPDGLELLRGKSARTIGRTTGLFVLMKGLPLAYDKDMQEDKEALFDVVDTTRESLDVAAIIVRNARFRADRCRDEASKGYLNATDLADLLVKEGVSFRDAHEKAGAAVRAAIELRCEVEDLPETQRKKLLPELARLDTTELKSLLSVDACLARRNALGGTSPARVRTELEGWKKRIAHWNNPR